MAAQSDPMRQAVHTALRQYDNLARLERNSLTSLSALWPLPADHWHESLSAPRKGIALRRLLTDVLNAMPPRLATERTLLVEKYIHKIPNGTLQHQYGISRAEFHRRLNAALDALAAELAMRDAAAVSTPQRLAVQTAFLPGYAPDMIVGLDDLLDTFVHALRQRLSQPRTPILITGLGGIGKTTLLDSGLRLWLMQEAPPVAGVLYGRVAGGDARFERRPAEILNSILQQLSVQLGKALVDPLSAAGGLTRLAAHLATRQNEGDPRYVIVLDDIESRAEHEAGLEFAKALSGNAIVVLASRQEPELTAVRGTVVRVQELNKRAAATLVRGIRATTNPPLPPFTPVEVKQIVHTVGGHPLALGLVVAQAGLGRLTLAEVLDGLREAGGLAGQLLYDHIYERSWALLSDFARQVLRWFTNFPTSGVTAQGLDALATAAGDTASTRQVERAVGELLTLNLLQRTTPPRAGFALHRLTYQFVEYKAARRPLTGAAIDGQDDEDDDIFFADD